MALHRQNGQGPTGEGIVRTARDGIKTLADGEILNCASFGKCGPALPAWDRQNSPRAATSEAFLARPHFLEPLLRRADRPLILRNTRTGLATASEVETAFSSAERRRGLLGRDGLGPGQALVIAPTNLVHTFSMRFPIDILFVARDGRVVKVRPSVPPRRIAGALRGFAVVELAAGELARSDTRTGDVIEVA